MKRDVLKTRSDAQLVAEIGYTDISLQASLASEMSPRCLSTTQEDLLPLPHHFQASICREELHCRMLLLTIWQRYLSTRTGGRAWLRTFDAWPRTPRTSDFFETLTVGASSAACAESALTAHAVSLWLIWHLQQRIPWSEDPEMWPPLFKLSSVPCVPVGLHYATYATL